jgi:hypothetical protein
MVSRRGTGGSVMRAARVLGLTVCGVALVMALLLALPGDVRTPAHTTVSKTNLHHIAIAISLYRRDHDGEFPPDLDELIACRALKYAEVLRDPYDQTPSLTERLQFETSFVYAGPLPRNVPEGVIVCYGREGIYPGHRAVLCVDHSTVIVAEADLADPAGRPRSSLIASYRAVMEAFGDDVTPERDAELRTFYEIEE